MANNALAPNIDNVLSDYVYAGRKLKEQRTNNMLNPQVQAALNYLKSVGSKFTSLDTPQDMSLGETAADIGLGFVPGIGTAQGARDFERARRENDYLGMGLSAASMLPVVGGVVKAGEKVAKSSKIAKALEQTAIDVNKLHPEMIDETGKPLTVYHGTNEQFIDFDPQLAKSEGKAFYFSRDAYLKKGAEGGFRNASTYGKNIMPVNLNIKNPHITGFTEQMPSETASQAEWDSWMKRLEEFNRSLDSPGEKELFYKDAIAFAKRQGHDSVIIKGIEDDRHDKPFSWVDPSDVYIVFEPKQIKNLKK